VPHIFDEGYRATISMAKWNRPGLFFVRTVVETMGRGGLPGTPGGNNFYFVLPLVVTPEGPLPGDSIPAGALRAS